jgi:hypothetical protein
VKKCRSTEFKNVIEEKDCSKASFAAPPQAFF